MLDLSNLRVETKPANVGPRRISGTMGVLISTGPILIDRYLWENQPELRLTLQSDMRRKIWHHVYGDLIRPAGQLCRHVFLHTDPMEMQVGFHLSDQLMNLLRPKL